MARVPRNPHDASAFGQGRSTGPKIGDDVGRKLKAFYDAVESAPLPEMFLDLLEKLDAAESQRDGKLGHE